MGQQLTGEDFNHLFRYFTTSAVRLEVQPVYTVTDEHESVQEYLAGKPRPVTAFGFYAAWLDRIREATEQGRRVQRVRVVDDPPTDYQRWEAWAGQYNIVAGEQISYLPRDRAAQVGVLVTDDWWLFDSQRVALMRFGPGGEPRGGEIISDPPLVAQHLAWWELAVRHSDPEPPWDYTPRPPGRSGRAGPHPR